MRMIALCGLAAGLGSAGAASAQQVESARPESITAALQRAGYQAELGTDSSGDPKITSASGGAKFWVYFYGCENHRSCSSIQFRTFYQMKSKPALTQINEWNRTKRFAQANLDSDGDPNIQFDMVLGNDGISYAVFNEALGHWTSVMGAFQKFIGW